MDPTAGIKEYNYEIWELTGVGAELTEDIQDGAEFSETDISSGHTVDLPRTCMYFLTSSGDDPGGLSSYRKASRRRY